MVGPVGTKFGLDELYNLVRCETVEAVRLRNGRTMWVDEEGRMSGKPINLIASLLAGGVDVVGDVLVTDAGEVD